MPDWVDSTVADWIQSETEKMNAIWGPPDQRSALAFVHIPPLVPFCHDSRISVSNLNDNRHTIQAVQENLNSSINPGLNGRSALRFNCLEGVTTFKRMSWARVPRRPQMILHHLGKTMTFGIH